MCGRPAKTANLSTEWSRENFLAQISVYDGNYKYASFLWSCLVKHVHLPTSKDRLPVYIGIAKLPATTTKQQCTDGTTRISCVTSARCKTRTAAHAVNMLAQSPTSNALRPTLPLHCDHNQQTTLASPLLLQDKKATRRTNSTPHDDRTHSLAYEQTPHSSFKTTKFYSKTRNT